MSRTQDRNPHFGTRLKELRESYNLSQSELASELGVKAKFGVQAISSWENSKREPNFNTLVSIADYFGVTTDYLLGRDYLSKKPSEVLLVKLDELEKNQKEALLKVIELLTKKG